MTVHHITSWKIIFLRKSLLMIQIKAELHDRPITCSLEQCVYVPAQGRILLYNSRSLSHHSVCFWCLLTQYSLFQPKKKKKIGWSSFVHSKAGGIYMTETFQTQAPVLEYITSSS